MPDEQEINITSYNQQGGITAYQVKIQPGDRQLTEANADRLERTLNDLEFVEIEVNAVMGDGEAFRFATQIMNFLTTKEFPVKGVNQAMYTAPVQGQKIEQHDNGLLRIVVGN